MYLSPFSYLSLLTPLVDEAAGREVPSMKYINFDRYITVPYHLIIKNWPLKKFASPSDIGGKTDLEIFRNAWTKGTTYFEELDNNSYDKFCQSLACREEPGDEEEQPEVQPHAHMERSTSTTCPSAPAIPSTASSAVPSTVVASAPVATTVSPTVAATTASSNPNLTTSPAQPSHASSIEHPAKRHKTAQDPFVCLMGPEGQVVGMSRTGRKKHCDAGVPRGPRKGKKNIPPTSSSIPVASPDTSSTPTPS